MVKEVDLVEEEAAVVEAEVVTTATKMAIWLEIAQSLIVEIVNQIKRCGNMGDLCISRHFQACEGRFCDIT